MTITPRQHDEYGNGADEAEGAGSRPPADEGLHRAGDERDHAGEERDQAAERRDQAGERRDQAAGRRDRAAGQRAQAAEQSETQRKR